MVNSVWVNGINHLGRRREGAGRGRKRTGRGEEDSSLWLLDQMRRQWLLRLPQSALFPFILLWSNIPHFPEHHSASPLKQPDIFKMIHLSRCSWTIRPCSVPGELPSSSAPSLPYGAWLSPGPSFDIFFIGFIPLNMPCNSLTFYVKCSLSVCPLI